MTTHPRYKLGRRAPHPAARAPRVKLAPFLTGPVPTAPPIVDWLSRVTDWPTYLNDELGDCTIAAAGHMIEAWTAYGQGHTVEITDQDVLAAYEAVSGYRPGQPDTDQGAVMQDVLSYWRKVGIGGHKILAFVQVDHTKPSEVDAALNLFGHLYVGVDFPASAMDQFDAGQPWDVVRNDGGIEGGHAVDLGYEENGTHLTAVTWGQPQKLTLEWWAKYVEECWAAITPEWLDANGRSPAGLDLYGLGEAVAALTGEPNPFPAPSPIPSPRPPEPTPGPPAVDPDEALAVTAREYVQRYHTGLNRQMARSLATWLAAKGLGG